MYNSIRRNFTLLARANPVRVESISIYLYIHIHLLINPTCPPSSYFCSATLHSMPITTEERVQSIRALRTCAQRQKQGLQPDYRKLPCKPKGLCERRSFSPTEVCGTLTKNENAVFRPIRAPPGTMRRSASGPKTRKRGQQQRVNPQKRRKQNNFCTFILMYTSPMP